MTAPGDLARRIVRRAGAMRVLVVGDAMLDDYVVGAVDRVSPEAPVPVVRATGRNRTPGGAANVARQLVALGAAVDLVGTVGDDGTGEDLLARCRATGIGTDGVVVVPGATTTRKQRVLAGRQQMLRIDWEDDPRPDDASLVASLVSALGAMPRPDAVVISDYAKGVVTPALVAEVTARARGWAVPVLVDPRPGPFTRYGGATVVKANRPEVEAAIGRRLGPRPELDLVAPVRRLLSDAGVERAVVTLGERGMVVVDAADASVVGQSPREVFDVSGAGDTVIAVLALGLVAGVPLVDAAALANRAAGVVVGRAGVTVAWPSDLEDDTDPAVAAGPAEVADRIGRWRQEGRRIVFTNGCFDLLHAGHLHLLRQAAELGDVLVVAVNSDRSVRRLKGPGRPFAPEADRLAAVSAIDGVDETLLLEDDDPAHLIDVLRPDVLVKGADYARSEVVGGDAVESWGGQVVLADLLPGWSTTAIARSRPGGAD